MLSSAMAAAFVTGLDLQMEIACLKLHWYIGVRSQEPVAQYLRHAWALRCRLSAMAVQIFSRMRMLSPTKFLSAA